MSEVRNSFSEPFLPLLTAPATAVRKQPSYIKGHRSRLRQRFQEGGADAMPDYEILELMLFRSHKQADTKPIAHALLKEFGTIGGVLAAPISRLITVPDVGTATALDLKIIEAAGHRMMRTKVLNKPVLSSWDALLDYCHAVMSNRDTEHFRVLFLDRKNTLIADEILGQGTVDHVPVYPREVARRAIELSASALILLHNHPSGDPTPSQPDILMTAKIQTLCDAMDIALHDHLIIGKGREVSFRSEGLL